MMSSVVKSLPTTWELTTLGEAYQVIGGGTPSTNVSDCWGGDTPWITSADIEGVRQINIRKYVTEKGIKESAINKVPPRTLLVVTRVGLGKIAIAATSICFSQDLQGLVQSPKLICPEYTLYLLSYKLQFLKFDGRGTTISGVTKKQLKDLTFPLPPLLEQYRIVAKIEELFSELDKGIENLKTARAQLNVYRQALLKHAFDGKLTAQWRAENRDKLETAAALQKRIQLERAQRYQQQLADWETAGKQGNKPKIPKTLPPLTAEELADLPELPEGWGWVHLEYLITGIDQGWSPKCENLPTTGAEWGVIKTTAIQHRNFLDKKNKALPKHLPPKKQHRLNVGDILVTRAGPRVRVGVCCLVRKVRENLMNCDKVYRIRSVNIICRPDYIEGVLNSPRILDELEKIKSGINDSGVNLNQGAFLRLAIPYCSLSEQGFVVMELERKLSVLTQLDQTITTSLQQAEALRQSILKKAFSGQLVPQDPHDEPAAALLARIKAEKSAQSHSKKIRK